jgi:hypothetical protein
MRCIAVIEAERPGLDSAIIWDRDGSLVAFAYLDGHTTMTRPLEAQDVDGALDEVRVAFQIGAGQLQRITDWSNLATIPPEQLARNPRTRW